MLLDDDDEDDDMEYVSALHAHDSEDYERRGFWNEYTGREGQFINSILTFSNLLIPFPHFNMMLS